MPTRRTSTRPLALLALAIATLIAACTPPAAPPAAPTVEITSHDDGERVFGSRTIAVTGTATNTAQVQIVQNGAVVATVAVVADAFTADVTLGNNLNELRVETPNALVGGILYVPDCNNHRVLIWNAIPTENGTEPDLVLGQPGTGATCIDNDDDQDGISGDPSARTFFDPWDAWTDGERLLVADYSNYRVRLCNTFPTSDFAPADVVIGQDSMTTRTVGSGATGFGDAYTVASNGNQILILDFDNARVLVSNAFPTSNGAAADAVLGQADFANSAFNDDDQNGVTEISPSARTVGRSYGVWMSEGVMIVNDYGNSRYALFVD